MGEGFGGEGFRALGAFLEGKFSLYFLTNRVDESRLEENWPVSKRGVAKNVVKKLNFVCCGSGEGG